MNALNLLKKKDLSFEFIMAVIIMAMFLIISATAAAADSPAPSGNSDLQRVAQIKLERISKTWVKQEVELNLDNGDVERGRFVRLESGLFLLATREGTRQVRSDAVNSVVLKRQPGDLALVGLTTLGCAALLGGATALSNAPASGVTVGAVVGGTIGFMFGWKLIYRDTVIQVK